jgi:hypothetical protein
MPNRRGEEDHPCQYRSRLPGGLHAESAVVLRCPGRDIMEE